MIRMLSLSLLLAPLFAGAAFAEEASSGDSRGLLLARRVARLENQKDLPSRAVWLSNRVVRNARSLAFHQEEKPKVFVKKRSLTIQN